MPTIRVDDEVYEWLQTLAVPFQDTPNSVLRRVAEIEGNPKVTKDKGPVPSENEMISGAEEITSTRVTGRDLSRMHGIDAVQSRFSEWGNWYENLTMFPGVLWDKHGYVRFATEQEYRNSPYLRIGVKLNVPNGGISSIPGYLRLG